VLGSLIVKRSLRSIQRFAGPCAGPVLGLAKGLLAEPYLTTLSGRKSFGFETGRFGRLVIVFIRFWRGCCIRTARLGHFFNDLADLGLWAATARGGESVDFASWLMVSNVGFCHFPTC